MITLPLNRFTILCIVFGYGWTTAHASATDTSSTTRQVEPRAMDARLEAAITSSDLIKIKALLDDGVPVNASWDSPLCYAITKREEGVVRLLLARGASADSVSDGRCSALYWAVYTGQPHLVKMLLDSGARPEPASGPVPLLVASEFGDEHVLQALISGGAKLTVADSDGNTPLHRAAQAGQANAARILLHAGADPAIRNRFGRTPAAYTTSPSRAAVAAVLREFLHRSTTQATSAPTSQP